MPKTDPLETMATELIQALATVRLAQRLNAMVTTVVQSGVPAFGPEYVRQANHDEAEVIERGTMRRKARAKLLKRAAKAAKTREAKAQKKVVHSSNGHQPHAKGAMMTLLAQIAKSATTPLTFQFLKDAAMQQGVTLTGQAIGSAVRYGFLKKKKVRGGEPIYSAGEKTT